jgi:hypothetical protein
MEPVSNPATQASMPPLASGHRWVHDDATYPDCAGRNEAWSMKAADDPSITVRAKTAPSEGEAHSLAMERVAFVLGSRFGLPIPTTYLPFETPTIHVGLSDCAAQSSWPASRWRKASSHRRPPMQCGRRQSSATSRHTERLRTYPRTVLGSTSHLWTRSCLPSATAARKGRVGAAPSPTSIGCPELASGADFDRWCRTRVRRPLLPVATKGECSVTALGAAALDHKRPSVSALAGRLLAAKSERAYPSVECVAETSSQSTKGALQVGAPEDFLRRPSFSFQSMTRSRLDRRDC